MSSKNGNSVTSSMVYKSLERYVILGFQMVVQVVMARLLAPSDYGVIAMMTVFISIASIFIHNGFNMAIVQKKEAGAKDYSTALTINLLIGLTLYTILFLSAPLIASFYKQPQLIQTLRVLALILPIGSVSSIQSAIATRQMRFRNLLICNVLGSVLSGIMGVTAAFLGFGFWALIIQQISSVVIIAIALTYHAEWKPRFGYDKNSAKEMFGFGWKLLVAGLINQLYTELNSLIIGRKYTSSDLAFYTKGKQFPFYVTTGVDSALQSVSLSAFSKRQNDEHQLHALFKKTLTANTFLLFPLLTILGVIAEPLVEILLTEKWLPIVPYMQICCFTFAFHPMASIDVQVIAAVGRSDIRLKLEFIKKPIGILLLLFAMNHGPMAIAISAAITSIVSLIIGAIACEKIVHYTVLKHFKDIMPIFLVSAIMGVIVFSFKLLPLHPALLLLLQVIIGLSLYIVASALFKIPGYELVKAKIFDIIKVKFVKK